MQAMITFEEYFGPWLGCPDATEDRQDNARELLAAVGSLLEAASSASVPLPTNPVTGSRVAGVQYGGFRPQKCQQGADHSAHKEGAAVDVFDPSGELDGWLSDDILERFDLYREHPSVTRGWCHLSTRPPGSGRRTFFP
jgi:hypothetical protein